MEGEGVKKGAWTKEEDHLLTKCVQDYGQGKWHLVPQRAGLNRCSRSCRMRWLNYLSPELKKGDFEEDEVDLIIRMHKLLGNRWSLIAGRIPGRTANDVKNFWNSHSCKNKVQLLQPASSTNCMHQMLMTTTSASTHDNKNENENDDISSSSSSSSSVLTTARAT